MTLEEILSSVENEDVREGIVSLINAEKQRGIESYQKKDSEVLKLKNKIKDIGYDSEKYDNYDSFFDTLKSKDEKVKSSELTIAQLNDKLNNLTTTLEQQKLEAENKAKESKRNKLTAELTKTIGNDFYGSDYMIESLVNNHKVDLVGNNIVGRNGDEIIPFDKFYDTIKEENKESLKFEQKRGSGSDQGVQTKTTSDFVQRVKDNIKGI